jgi:hypothetical protein
MEKVGNVLGLVNSWELGKGETLILPSPSRQLLLKKHDPQELSFHLHLFP